MALIAELIYRTPVSRRDPTDKPVEALGYPAPAAPERKWADYSYAHGGKDGHPFPVDCATYDRNIAVLTDAVRKCRLREGEKCEALRRLASIAG